MEMHGIRANSAGTAIARCSHAISSTTKQIKEENDAKTAS
jgi:hypothetical protein